MTIALYPTKRQAAQFDGHLEAGRLIYNQALQRRIEVYRDTKKTLGRFDQTAELTRWRAEYDFLSSASVSVQRDALDRLDKGFKAFFRRVKSGEGKPGFPRFKPAQRWHSFSVSNPGKCIKKGRIRVTKVDGLVRCRNLREIGGRIKVQRIVRKAGRWFCQLVIEDGVLEVEKRPIEKAIGIDVGLDHFYTDNSGNAIENPRFLRRMAERLRRDHRRVSRRKKGSNRRRLAVLRLQKTYDTLANHRQNFAHHVSKDLVAGYDLIAIEDLNVQGMVRGRLAKHILDAGWSQLRWQLAYKAERAGCTLIAVVPNGTSQECSGCGETAPKGLSVRIHKCPHCGLVIDRDHNAALNILHRAMNSASGPGRGIGNGRGETISLGSPSGLVEASSPNRDTTRHLPSGPAGLDLF